MSQPLRIPGDEARAMVSVAVKPDLAFRVFTEHIDSWWRRGMKYRIGGKNRGILHIQPGVGGGLFETVDTPTGPHIHQTGIVKVWEPGQRLVFDWRAVNFAPEEATEVEVLFEPTPTGTLVSVIHRGWAKIREDHPVRHGQPVPTFLRENGLWWGELLTSLREFCGEGGQAPTPLDQPG